MRVGWVYHPFFLKHDTGPMHPERPERLETIVQSLDQAGLLRQMVPLGIESADVSVIERVHEPAYVELVRLACEQGMTYLGDEETNICAESYEVARMAVGGVLAACDAVMSDRIQRAFCAARPPGHHAERDHAMGYCLFNNVAIAADYLVRRYGLHRVAIVDWDAHHGNGTQQIFEDRADVLFVSLHESPDFQYPYTGHERERGQGAGEGYTLNCPMRPGSGDDEYRRAFRDRIIPTIESYAPKFLLISAGFDAAREDRVAGINLEPECFEWMTEQLAAIADRHAHGRIISVLEGGYDLPSLGRCVTRHVQALMPS